MHPVRQLIYRQAAILLQRGEQGAVDIVQHFGSWVGNYPK
jgi:hypothetical protein